MTRRVLIVDDDVSFRSMLHRLLRGAGYDVAAASNGIEALSIHRQNPVDLVITDLIMPEKEGIETIRDFCRQYSGTRIIAMSGGGRIPADQYLEMAARLGAQKTFTKPIKTSELLAAVEELLGGKNGGLDPGK